MLTEDIGKRTGNTVSDVSDGERAAITAATSIITRCRGMATTFTWTDQNIGDNFTKIRSRGSVSIIGRIIGGTRGIGKMGNNMD